MRVRCLLRIIFKQYCSARPADTLTKYLLHYVMSWVNYINQKCRIYNLTFCGNQKGNFPLRQLKTHDVVVMSLIIKWSTLLLLQLLFHKSRVNYRTQSTSRMDPFIGEKKEHLRKEHIVCFIRSSVVNWQIIGSR